MLIGVMLILAYGSQYWSFPVWLWVVNGVIDSFFLYLKLWTIKP
jgi:hypothetical protein